MRSTASSNDIMTIVRDNFKKFWTVPAFGLFWLLIWGLIPVMLMSSGDDIINFSSFAFNENIGYPIFVLLLPIVCGMTVFSYLQNPSAANYMHSLPLSRSKLFGANVLSGLLMIAAPIVANGIIMSIYAVCTDNPLFFKWMIVTFICCSAIFAITAFAAMISGNTLMHLFNACFFNGVLALILIVFIDLCEELLLGYETSDGLMSFVFYSNAFTASIGEGSRLLICIVYLAVTLVALLVAWAIYKRRPIERTGESLIFSWTRALLFLICVFSGAILIGLFNAMIMSTDSITRFDHNMIIGMLIGGVATFVIGSILIDRTAKIFTKRNLLPAAIALVLAFAVSGTINADVLGYSKYIPEAKDVKSVCVDVQNTALFAPVDDEGNSADYFPGYAGYYQNVTEVGELNNELYPCFGSEESIEAITGLQERLIGQKAEDMTVVDSIRFVYELNNGKTVRRSYDIYAPDESEDYAVIDRIDPKIRESAGKLYDSREFKTIYSLNNLKPDYFEEGAVTYCADPYGDNSGYHAVSTKDAIELKAAMEKDFQKLTYEKAMQYSGTIDITRKADPNTEMDTEESLTEVLDLSISKEAKNTRAWLKAHGYSVK